ncbi:dihydrofolate reductase family protein [Aggregatilinea lenta]|uniref:dihydrofolate reductase family protein n=1 Tax=Aggregatilinea lenta TaxID=913108 RepID=UPI000E5A6D94|nr:dihydrofolate reductase family protein [Aggregatilinea lenta]
MSKVICGITMSVDGFVAGPNQSEQNPFGDVPDTEGLLHSWMFDEPERHAAELAELSSVAGAYIMGRNMYGPAGEKYDHSWKGWWGDDPPFHAPVFVLTHKSRDPILMEGGTTFTFVPDGIRAALKQAEKAAGGKPVAIAGGANVVNQYLAANAIDELWLHIAPGTIGQGARLFDQIPNLRMEPISLSGTSLITHIKYRIIK